jgi:DNA-binding transcriptional ArsR family regulator
MNSRVKSNYSDEDIKIARFAKALAHPARISILRHLASLDTCRFTDISNELSLANSTVYQHLSELKKSQIDTGKY